MLTSPGLVFDFFLPTFYTFEMVRMKYLNSKGSIAHSKAELKGVVFTAGVLTFVTAWLEAFWAADVAPKEHTVIAALLISLFLFIPAVRISDRKPEDMVVNVVVLMVWMYGTLAFNLMTEVSQHKFYPPYVWVTSMVQVFLLLFGGMLLAKIQLKYQLFLFYVVFPLVTYAADKYLFHRFFG